MNNEEKFVKIPMRMFAYEKENYVTDDEIAVYYEVVFHGHIRNESISRVNVELLYSRLQWDTKTPSRGKKRVLRAILGLRDKGYIAVECDDEDIKNTSYLVIHSPKSKSFVFEEESKSGTSVYVGWTAITEKIMNKAKKDINSVGQRLKVLSYVLWRCKINYAICYEEWANVLSISVSTAKRVIKSLKEEGLINVESGIYYTDEAGNVRQEINKYTVNEDVAEAEYKPTVLGKKRRVNKIAELLANTIDDRVKNEKSNLFKYGSRLTKEDMYIYLTTKCPIVKEWGEKRFSDISKNVSGKIMVDLWRSEVKNELTLKENAEGIFTIQYQKQKERQQRQEELNRKEDDEKLALELSELPDEEELLEDEEIALKVSMLEADDRNSIEERNRKEKDRLEVFFENLKQRTSFYNSDENEEDNEESLPFA